MDLIYFQKKCGNCGHEFIDTDLNARCPKCNVSPIYKGNTVQIDPDLNRILNALRKLAKYNDFSRHNEAGS